MLSLLPLAAARYARLLWQTAAAFFDPSRRFRGALLLLFVLPLIICLQIVHWILWAVDEVVFRRYRDIRIERPVFVIGPPRSGTTFLHHVLSSDPNFTTFRLWECLFGVTISGRKLCLGLAAADRLVGRPIARLIDWLSRRGLSAMDDVHPLRLDEPEEDFLVFLPFAGCFLLLVPFPSARWLWSMSELDTRLDDRQRERVMRWYRRCVQKHLYVFGTERTFLSKNASFAGTSESLLNEFPDARILRTWREPEKAVPSQLSSLRPGFRAFGFDEVPENLQDRLLDMMVFYYRHLDAVAERHRDRVARISTKDMQADLQGHVERAFDAIGLEISDDLRRELEASAAASNEHRSAHKYSLEEFGLSAELIRSRFEDES